ncbi:MAG: UbiA family prenyltransferase [Pseudomonadota bacterium]
MTFGTILRLGRVSNLPTVWTNALAGTVLAGGNNVATFILAAVALTLFYEGGMWMNDYFDAKIDAEQRSNRPIPQGEIRRGAVLLGGALFLIGGTVAAFALSPAAGWAGVALAAMILLYDWLHKRTILSPVIMGATRFLSYALAALAIASLDDDAIIVVFLGAAGLFAWIVGLTYAAKQEAYDRIGSAWPLFILAVPLLYAGWLGIAAPLTLIFAAALAGVAAYSLFRLFRREPGDVPRAVVALIAGVALYDAALIASTGSIALAFLAAAGFGLTLALQRVASGT